jgi:hypothetical protein
MLLPGFQNGSDIKEKRQGTVLAKKEHFVSWQRKTLRNEKLVDAFDITGILNDQ